MRWKYRRLLATFQSTLPARGATGHLNRVGLRLLISIHAPRTGSDTSRGTMPLQSPKNFNPRSPHGERRRGRKNACAYHDISIHAPRTGSDIGVARQASPAQRFQSTLPARGATADAILQNICKIFQSTLPARGATFIIRIASKNRFISIHAPRTGSDLDRYEGVPHYYTFQSTLPARGATETAR